MVKKKGGRDLNPMDAFRKSERAKQVSKNKKGRQLQREAGQHTSDPAALRQQLKEVLDQEQEGGLNPTLRLKKKALQQAYNQAIQKQMEKEAAEAAQPTTSPSDGLHYGAGGNVPLEGQFSHMLPPLPGHPPNTYLPPLPPPPPLPPLPQLPHSGRSLGQMLPPRPDAPPDRMRYAPPSHGQMHAPSTHSSAPMAVATGKFFILLLLIFIYPPPNPLIIEFVNFLLLFGLKTGPAELRTDVQPVIAAKSTVVTLPKAHLDKTVTSLVPSSLLTRRPAPKASGGPSSRATPGASTAPGFGLVPRSVSAVTGKTKEEPVRGGSGGGNVGEVGDDTYESFMDSMKELGAI